MKAGDGSDRPASWFRPRHYLHFDVPVGYKAAHAIVTDSAKVNEHAFYPFLASTRTSRKQVKDKETKKLVWKKKPREIACSAHIDSHIYSFYSHQLSELYEQTIRRLGIGDSILAFRSLEMSNIHFALRAFDAIRDKAPCHVITLDIQKFFDNLDHKILKAAWCAALGCDSLPLDHFKVFKSLTKWCKVEKSELFRTLGLSMHNPRRAKAGRICDPAVFRDQVRAGGLLHRNEQNSGIPQGSPISAVLSNLYMIGFDEQMYGFVCSIGGAYFRYCDDIIIVCPLDRRDDARSFAETCISTVRLEIQQGKTDEVTFSSLGKELLATKPLQYLGFTFDGAKIRIRSSSIARYYERMKKGVSAAKSSNRNCNERRHSRGQNPKGLHLKNIYRRYSYLGRSNFVTYGLRASSIMDSDAVRQQLKPLWQRLKKEYRNSR